MRCHIPPPLVLTWLIASVLWPNYSQMHAYSCQGGEEGNSHSRSLPAWAGPSKGGCSVSPLKRLLLWVLMIPRDMAEGCIFLSSIQMLGVHSFSRDTFLKTLEKVQGSRIRQHRLIGIPFRKVWGIQNSKKKSSTLQSHIFLHHHALKDWVCWGNTAPWSFYIQAPLGLRGSYPCPVEPSKLRWVCGTLWLKATWKNRPKQRWLIRICTNSSKCLQCEFQSTVCWAFSHDMTLEGHRCSQLLGPLPWSSHRNSCVAM